MTSAHTPGPWSAAGSGTDGSFEISTERGVICSRAPWPANASQSHANACLIAATPDLAAALQNALALAEIYGVSKPGRDGLMVNAFAHIKKEAATALRKAGVEELPDDEEPDPTAGCAHEWSYTGTAYGGDDESYSGEGRVYCSKCGADGDA